MFKMPTKLWIESIAIFALIICVEFSSAQEIPIHDWTKSLGGTASEQPTDLVVDPSGNVYVSGHFGGTVDFDPGAAVYNLTGAGSNDGFVVKTDPDGNFIWAVSIGGTGNDDINAIVLNSTGDLYITGIFYNTVDFDPGPGVVNITSIGGADFFILKLDVNGNFVWVKTVGSITYDEARDITIDNIGNVYTTGFFLGTADFDPGPGSVDITPVGQHDTFVLKLDASGDFVWVKAFTGTDDVRGENIAVDGAGDLIVSGGFVFGGTTDFDPGPGVFPLTGAGSWDIFVCKLDNAGNFVWADAIAGVQPEYDNSLAIDPLNNILITGYFKTTTDFDPGLGTFNLTSNGSNDPFILKLNSSGSFVWAKSLPGGGSTDDRGEGIATDASGNVYVTGEYTGTIDLDPGPGTFNKTTIGSADLFVLKLDNNGNFVWAYAIGSGGFDVGLAVTIDAGGKLHAAGSFSLSADFDPGACVFGLTSNGGYDTFFQQISTGTLALPTITSFSPTTGPIGTTITITGTNFSAIPTDNSVVFFNNKPATVSASNATSITTSVPAGATTGKISVTVNCNTVISSGNFTVTASSSPTISSFTPSSGPVGTTVTITGTNFDPTPANNTVKFNGTTAAVSVSSSTSITCTVPSGASSGKITVTVAGNTATSVVDFTVTTSPAITITLQPSSTSACVGDMVTFSVSATGTTNISYQWQAQGVDFIFSDITDGGAYSGSGTSLLTVNSANGPVSGGFRCRVNGDIASQVVSNVAILLFAFPPLAPTSVGVTTCSPSSATLTASGGTSGQFRWYTVATGGTPIAGETGSTYVTPVLTTTTTYYVAINNGSCESSRTAMEVSISGNCNTPPIIAEGNFSIPIQGSDVIDLKLLLSDADNNIDLSSLKIVNGPESGAIAFIDANQNLSIDYSNTNFQGEDMLTIEVCDVEGLCIQQQLLIEVVGSVIVYNGISPGTDNKNDFFQLRNIEVLESTKANHVSIFNRWGDLVFDVADYNNSSRVFMGQSNSGQDLPSGVYFYKITFSSGEKSLEGYLTLKR
ncbi:MAG: IPT/TIG domain-containing protein [Cyclobacteriaceae bacterium]